MVFNGNRSSDFPKKKHLFFRFLLLHFLLSANGEAAGKLTADPGALLFFLSPETINLNCLTTDIGFLIVSNFAFL